MNEEQTMEQMTSESGNEGVDTSQYIEEQTNDIPGYEGLYNVSRVINGEFKSMNGYHFVRI